MIAEALVKGCPLLYCALAFLLAWRAGVLNIGAEGQFLLGALAATAVATRVPLPPAAACLLALGAGAIAGSLWAGIAAWLLRRRGVLEVLSTILLNFVAAGLVSLLVRGPLQERARTFPQSEAVPESVRLPAIGAGPRLHAGLLLGVLLAVALALVLGKSRAGFRLRAAGAGPRAALFAGIAVPRVREIAFLASGAIAGLGGAVELLGVTGRLFDSFSPGYGYLGLAAAVVAGLSPLGSVASAAAFGLLNAGGTLVQRRYGVSSALALVLEAAVLLGALSVSSLLASRRAAR